MITLVTCSFLSGGTHILLVSPGTHFSGNFKGSSTEYIATDKALFHSKNADIILIPQQKHMLWVLIGSASARHF